MSVHGAPEATDHKQVELRDELSAGTWHSRRALVSRLLQTANDPAAEQLLQVLRDDHRDLARANAAMEVLAHTPSDVVPGLLELLRHPDAELRGYAALTLGERGDPRAISPLVERLADDDTNVRSQAIEALGKLRAAAAVDSLIAIVEELHFELAFPALDALKAIGDRRIAHRLLPLLAHSLYALATIEALGELGDEEVIRPLLDRFQDAGIPPSAIAIALARMQERHEELYGACELIPELVRGMTTPALVQAFLATITKDTAARDTADAGRLAAVLSWLPGEEVDWTLASLLERFPFDEKVLHAVARRGPAIVPLLTGRLSGATYDARQAIIEVLLRIADRTAAPALLGVLETEEDELAIARALEALARLGEPRLDEVALRHFGHPNARVRQAAVAAFGCAGRESATGDLQLLWSSDSPLVRDSVLRAAAYLGEPEGIEIVIAGCQDADEQVRRTAIEQAATIDDDRVPDVLQEALRSENPLLRAAAISAVSKTDMGHAAAGSLLHPLLQDSDVWVRYFAIRALLGLDEVKDHLAELIALAKSDRAMQVRLAAMEALGACGEGAFPALAELVASPVAELAETAILALPRTGHPQALAVLAQQLLSSTESSRQKAVQALAALPMPAAVETLQALALGTDSRLATAAVEALGRASLPRAAMVLVEVLAWPARRPAAIAALVFLRDAALGALEAGLAHPSLDVRRAVVEVLARIRTAGARETLEAALRDEAAAVRHAALAALAHGNARKAAGPRARARRGRP